MDNKTQEAWEKAIQSLHRIADSLAVEPRPKQGKNPEAKWYQTLVGWKVRLEILAFIFAIGYAIITFLQWRDANSNFRASQRAWVLVASIETPNELVAGQPFPINTIAKNYGLSPAQDVHATGDPITSGGVCFIAPIEASNKQSIIIAPQAEQRFTGHSLTLSQGCIEAVRDGRSILSLQETLTYADIFNRIHTTQFCAEYSPMTRKFHSCDHDTHAD